MEPVAAGRARRVKSTADQSRRAGQTVAPPVRYLTDMRLDFPDPAPLRKSYIVASTFRCGSTFLCKELWQTGVLGAPWEYLNPGTSRTTNPIKKAMMKRLGASSEPEYLAKLIACRTSKNGIFGVKAHFRDFQAALRDCPAMLDVLSPVTFIYMDREDRLAQAVSMAKALQTNSWTSFAKPAKGTVRYDRDLISKCLGRLERQRLGWSRWFEANNVQPVVVKYEELSADKAGVIRSIIELFGVQNDEPQEVHLPAVEKQGDGTNKEWVASFKQETEAGIELRKADAADAKDRRIVPAAEAQGLTDKKYTIEQARDSHFFDRYDRYLKRKHPVKMHEGSWGLRVRHRYEAIVARNRELFQKARVLDIGSSDGLWSLAALDAGAVHVVGIESGQKRVATAREIFAGYGVKSESYQFINSEIFAALSTFGPQAFDLILCKVFFELSDPRLFFSQLNRLRPKHVILDTGIVSGEGPITRFALRRQDLSRPKAVRNASIVSTPNHQLIAFFCDHFGFRCRLVDWQAIGAANWIGIRDYERNRRRTYVLDRTS